MYHQPTRTGKQICGNSFWTNIASAMPPVDEDGRIECFACGRLVKLRRHPIHKGLLQVPRHAIPGPQQTEKKKPCTT